jgi:hypothetical protein
VSLYLAKAAVGLYAINFNNRSVPRLLCDYSLLLSMMLLTVVK